MITIAIIIVLFITFVKLIYDYYLWLDNKPVNHRKEWLIVAISSTPSIFVFAKESDLIWCYSIPLSAVMIALFIWLFFDGLYNVLRGYNYWFTGSNDPDDAKMDNLLQGLKLWQHITVKTVPLILLIFIYVLNLKNG